MNTAQKLNCVIFSVLVLGVAACVSQKGTNQVMHNRGRIYTAGEGSRYFDGTNWYVRTFGIKPRWIEFAPPFKSGAFHWFFPPDRTNMLYFSSSMGDGRAYFDVLKQKTNEIVFKVTKVLSPCPLNLATGEIIEMSDAIGKKYKIRTKGLEIVSVAEIK